MRGDPTDRWLRRGCALCLAAVGVYLAISAFEPFRTNWGDPWSDGNAMTAGRYFARDGFVKTAFTPILDVGPLDQDSLRYTHYPPLPDLVNGLEQTLLGGGYLAIHRLIAIGLSALGLLFAFRYLRALWDETIAALAVALIATNLLFLQYADTIHHIPLYFSTGFACLWAAVRWLDTGRRGALVVVGLATWLCFLASYDFYFFLSIMIVATVKLRGAKILRGRGLAVILGFGLAALASIAVKNLLVIWAVGVPAWHRDVIYQFFERASGASSKSYKEMIADVVFWRLWRFGSPLLFAAVVVQLVGVIDRVRGRAPSVSPRPLILLGAGLPFLLVFSQLVVEQYHPLLLILPFAAVAIAAMIQQVWTRVPGLAIALIVLYLGWQGWQLRLLKKAFLEPADVAAVEKVLAGDHHRIVLSNIFVDGPVRYLWNRHLFTLDPELPKLYAVLETYGADSPLTLVMLRHTYRHLYDKAMYSYFGTDRRLPWIARPDYFRNATKVRFDARDKAFADALDGVGTIAYESRDMIVRTVSEADLDRHQRALLPPTTPRVIDFETVASEPYKLRGIGAHVAGTPALPGYASLSPRTPARIQLTLQGFKNPAIGPPIRTSALRLRLPPGRDLQLSLEVSTHVANQAVTVKLNGHALGGGPIPTTEPLAWVLGPQPVKVERLELRAPAASLAADGVQLLELELANASSNDALRLHRLEIVPAS
ncbi:MAG: hypothetical protein ABIY55_10340 [Kofleriaceae bacterium]